MKDLLLKNCIPVTDFARQKETTKQTILNNTLGEEPKLDSVRHYNIIFIIDNKKSQLWKPLIQKRPRATTSSKYKLISIMESKKT